ncbi:hypothetical protein SOVF_191910 [Spinacia oleracea]|uniref:Pentatricopeptide repeat-containing protein At3g54980, mitochondrial-like n=1 Tax=Spinacia oleracea TaxID=3562 RepID=A0A9R0I4C9_SPIOL|nr:pentatricopeptide repeat-containing protein At3g54980, mitochondrial-like [Spinacia oleracea]KNA05276.1 hypothetical protein SOVF_191910 [Spinacia oleracea]
MRNLSKSLQISSTLLRSSVTHKPLSSSLTSLSSSEPLISQDPISESSLPNQSPISNDFNEGYSSIPISQNHQNPTNFSHGINGLLSSKDPPSAMEYFKWAEKQPGFGEGVDSFCLLLHNFMGLEGQQCAVKELVSTQNFPDAKTVIRGLNDCSNRFGFDLDSRIYNYLLCGFIKTGRIEDSISCVEWMLENKIDLWVSYLNDLIYELGIQRKMIKEAKELYDKVFCKGNVVNGGTVRIMMKACLKDGNPSEADRYFRLARDKGVELDPAAFSCAIVAVSQKPDSNAACELLMEMKEKGWVPSEGTYTQTIIACVKQRNLMEALRLKDEMVSCGKPMNLVVATTLMKGYCVSGDLESALGLFAKLDEYELSPNNITFSVLIDGCCINGNMEKASELYDQMIEKGIEPSVYNVNSMIKGFLKARLFEKAYEMFNKAAESGLVDDSSLNSLLSCLCKDGNMDEAQKFWGMALQCGIEPNLQNYNNLILGYCRKGNVAMAHSMYVEMIGKGLNPNVFTFTILINGHFKKGEVDKALNLFDEMSDQRIDCTDHTYNTMIGGLCKHGKTSLARNMLENFIKEANFVPSCMTYNSIVGGLIKEGDLDSALSVYNEMGENGVSPDICTYTIFIDAFRKSNNFDLALKMQNEMISKGLELDITAYGTLIDGCCKRRDMESACKLFNELCKSGLSPNIYIYNNMISGYRNLNNMEVALSFQKKMTEQGVLCDLETYTTLIDGLLKEDKLKSALEFYDDMVEKGIRPDKITYTVLVKGLCKKGKLENARNFFKEMEEKGVTPNSLIYNALVAGYFREGNLPEAFKLYDEMLERGLTPDKMTFDFLMNANFKPGYQSSRTSSDMPIFCKEALA